MYDEQSMDMELSPGNCFLSVAQRPVVLVVDDDEDNLRLMTFVLEIFNCTLITAKDGETALALAKNYRPDLILLDIILPDLSGVEIVQKLRHNQQTRQIPVIALTALATPEDKEKILSAGCNEYMKKPYMVDELEMLLNRYLG